MRSDSFSFDAAFGFVCRQIIPAVGGVPYESFGAGVCIHPDGVVLTACHVIQNLDRHISPFDDDQANAFVARGELIPAEEHERPHFMFSRHLRLGRGVHPRARIGRSQLQVFPVHHFNGNPTVDAGVVCLSPTEAYRPLPFVRPRTAPPRVGERVLYLGHYHPEGTPRDALGYVAGGSIYYGGTTVVAHAGAFFLLDFAAERGMSGGPVMDPDTGQLLGIIVEVWPAAKSSREVGIDRPLTCAASIKGCGRLVVQTLTSQGYSLDPLR